MTKVRSAFLAFVVVICAISFFCEKGSLLFTDPRVKLSQEQNVEWQRGQSYEVRVLKIIDGDTIKVDKPGYKKINVRFFGIDAPEKKQVFGIESTCWLASQLSGKKVRLDVVNKDRYGRLVAKVYADDACINVLSVQEGMSWYYDAYAKKEEKLKLAQKLAQSQRKGLWKDNSPEPPWLYRKKVHR